MGIEKWVNKIKDAAEQSKKDDADPKKRAEKSSKSAKRAFNWMQKGLEGYKKVSQASDDARDKTIELAKKAEPIAEKIDDAASDFADSAKKTFSEKMSAGKKAWAELQEKRAAAKEQNKTDKENKPSTGSSLIDLIAPALPDDKDQKKSAPKSKAAKQPKR